MRYWFCSNAQTESCFTRTKPVGKSQCSKPWTGMASRCCQDLPTLCYTLHSFVPSVRHQRLRSGVRRRRVACRRRETRKTAADCRRIDQPSCTAHAQPAVPVPTHFPLRSGLSPPPPQPRCIRAGICAALLMATQRQTQQGSRRQQGLRERFRWSSGIHGRV